MSLIRVILDLRQPTSSMPLKPCGSPVLPGQLSCVLSPLPDPQQRTQLPASQGKNQSHSMGIPSTSQHIYTPTSAHPLLLLLPSSGNGRDACLSLHVLRSTAPHDHRHLTADSSPPPVGIWPISSGKWLIRTHGFIHGLNIRCHKGD